MELRERRRASVTGRDSTTPALSQGNPPRRTGTFARAFVGVPLLVLAAIAWIASTNRGAAPAATSQIHLGSASGGRISAVVFGAGSGIHILRLSSTPVPVSADLSNGPLRIVALRSVRLAATHVGDPGAVRLTATGPVLQLRRDGGTVSVRTGF